jgi:hypothetical protein
MPVPQESLFVVEQASCLFLIAITYRDSKAPCNFCQSAFWAIDYLSRNIQKNIFDNLLKFIILLVRCGG